MSDDAPTKTSGASLGPVLIAIAAFFLYFAKDIPGALAKNDPGPQVWPMLLASCLLLAGVAYSTAWFVRTLLTRREDQSPSPRRNPLEYLTDWGLQNVALIMLGLVLLLAALPHLGFAISAGLFSTVVMARLGHPAVAEALRRRSPDRRPSLWREVLVTTAIAAAISIVLVALIIVLFDRVFDSPLPKADAFNLPF
ncbi:MAG: tripartite tricarboxylate transporter TctB family protein [Pirellulaceae bacterium]